MEENNNPNEPIILGTLRKEKSSKPIFVFLVFILIISATFGLPYLQEYAKDPNTILGKVYNMFFKEENVEKEDTTITRYTLNENTNILFNNIILSNVKINNNNIKFDLVNTTANSIILDTTNYYLEITNENNNLIKRVKLLGNITREKNTIEYDFSNIRFSNIAYYGNVVTFTNYEDIEFNVTELGIANLTCSINTNIYKYTFEDLSLKSLIHNYKYNNISDIDKYIEKFNFYTNKSKKINQQEPAISNINEMNNGFEFVTSLDLSKIDINDFGEYIDYNYYKLDTEAKKVKYEMEAKGYKCL